MPFFPEHGPKLSIVFYDAVVHDEKASIMGRMRMTIFFRDGTMGRPAGMSDGCMVVFQMETVDDRPELHDAADGFDELCIAASVDSSESGAVIATVLESLEATEYLLGSISGPRIAKYTTHKRKEKEYIPLSAK